MINLIGIGKTGCSVVEKLEQHSQYSVYKIDTGLKGLKKNGIYDFPSFDSPEDYESKCPSMKNFLKNVNGETLVVISGGELISAASLKILETIRSRATISLLYYKPEAALLSTERQLLNRGAFNIFQEYARSGVFERMFVISHELLRNMMGDVPISEFENNLSNQISMAYHMIKVLQNDNPIYGVVSPNISMARLSTIGMASIENDEEMLFYELLYAREKTYFYLIPKKELDTDIKLMNKIIEQVKRKSKDGKIKINFTVHESDYEEPFVYVISSSSIIQETQIE